MQKTAKEAIGAENDVRDPDLNGSSEVEGFDEVDITEEQIGTYSDIFDLTEEYKDEHSNEDGEYTVHRGMSHRTPALTGKLLDDPEQEELDIPDEEVTITYSPAEEVAEDFAGQFQSGMVHTIDAQEYDSAAMDALLTHYTPEDGELPEERETPPQGHHRDTGLEDEHIRFYEQGEAEHLIADQQTIETDELSIPRNGENAAELIQRTTENPEEADESDHFVMSQLTKKMDRDGEQPSTEEGLERLKDWAEYRRDQDSEEFEDYDTTEEDVERVNNIIRESLHHVEGVETKNENDDSHTFFGGTNNTEIEEVSTKSLTESVEFDDSDKAENGEDDEEEPDWPEPGESLDTDIEQLAGGVEQVDSSDHETEFDEDGLEDSIHVEYTGGLEEDTGLEEYDTEDIEKTDDLGELDPSHGNTMFAKDLAEFEDGTQAVYTDTDKIDEEFGERAVTSSLFARELYDDYEEHGVPEIKGDPEDGYFFTAVAPGEDVAKASDENVEEVDEDDFYKHAAAQVMLGNNDAHSSNVKVDEEGGLHWFDMDHAGGEIDEESAFDKKNLYDDGWERIKGELAKTGEALGVEGDRDEIAENIVDRAVEEAKELDDAKVAEARQEAAEQNEEMAQNIFDNIMSLQLGLTPGDE